MCLCGCPIEQTESATQQHDDKDETRHELPTLMTKLFPDARRLAARLLETRFAMQIVRGAGVTFTLQAGSVILLYILQLLLVRWMGKNDYGSYVFAYTWAQLLAVFGAAGLTLSVLKYLPDYIANHDWRRVKGLLIAFRTTVLVASIFLGGLVALVFMIFPQADIDRSVLYLGLALTPLIALKDLQTETIRSAQRVALAYAPPLVIQPMIVLVTGFFLFTVSGDLNGAHGVGMMAFALAIVLIMQAVIVRNEFGRSIARIPAIYATREWVRTSLPMLVIHGALVVMNRADVVVVGMMLGTTQAGVYAVAARTAMMISFVLEAINAVVAPNIAPLYNRRDMRALQQLVSTATLLATILALGGTLGMIGLSHVLLGLFGEGFIAGRTSLIILSISHLINSAAGPVGYLMHLTGHQHISGRVYVLGALLNVGLNLALVPTVGIEGAAIATAVAMVVQNVLMYTFVRRKLGINTLAFYSRRR